MDGENRSQPAAGHRTAAPSAADVQRALTMFSLESLDLLLAISEAELIEELIVGLLAAPALAVFFEKFPRLKRALTKDLPEWKLRLRQRIHDTPVPPDLAKEFYLYQHCQQIDAATFQSELATLVDSLETLNAPFIT